MRIYVASSWRNQIHPSVVDRLRKEGHDVYDFKNPPSGTGFSWKQTAAPGTDWQRWTTAEFRASLAHPIAESGFRSDMDALQSCDACVCVLPCGRSAHLELGWAAGAGKRSCVLLAPQVAVSSGGRRRCKACQREEPSYIHQNYCPVSQGRCEWVEAGVLPNKDSEPELMYKMCGPAKHWQSGNGAPGVCATIEEVVAFVRDHRPVMTELEAWKQLAQARGALLGRAPTSPHTTLPRPKDMGAAGFNALVVDRSYEAYYALQRLGAIPPDPSEDP